MQFFDLPEYLQFTLVFINLIIVILNVYCVISGMIFGTKKSFLVTNTGLIIISSVMLFFSCNSNFDHHKGFGKISQLTNLFDRYALPFIVVLALLCIASGLCLYYVLRWKRVRITPASIKEGMDKLPAGLCYHNEQGVLKLINHRMDYICRAVTGGPLFDANEFWRRLVAGDVLEGNSVEKLGDAPIITLYEGITLSFTKIEREIGSKRLFEVRATDITNQYALNLELRKYNDELRSLNRRLEQYSENVLDITREREILAAKVNIHDMLGKALLVTKRYIENGDADITKDELTNVWNGTLYLFDGGFTDKDSEVNLDELYDAAKLMGIRLNVEGRIPKDNRILRFVMSGARECLTNAVHHAKASELQIHLHDSYGFTVIDFTNDGIQPEKEISEGGGLSTLRRSVEESGGVMETYISPKFILRLKIPAKEVQ